MTTTNKTYPYTPDSVTPPGETVRECMEHIGLTPVSLAEKLGLTLQNMDGILAGNQPISSETAIKLEAIFGPPANFWNNLQANYTSGIAKGLKIWK